MVKLLVVNVLIYFMFNFGHPSTPDLLEIKNVPDYVNGFLAATMNLSVFLFSPIVLKFYKKINIIYVVALGPFIYGLMQLGFAYFSSPLLILIFRFLSGIPVAGVTVSILLFAKEFTDKKGNYNVYSLIFATTALGGVFGLLFAGKVAHINPYLPFVLQAVFGLVYFVLFYFILKTIKQPKITDDKKMSLIDNFKYIFSSKRMMINLFVLLMMIISLSTLTSNIGYYSSQELDFTSDGVSYIMSISSLVNFISNLFLVNIFKKYFKPYTVLVYICASVIVGFVLLYLNFSLIFAAIFYVYFILMLASVRSIITEIIVYKKNTQDAANVLSASNSINALAAILAGYMTGIVYSFNPNYMFVLMFVAICMSLITLLVYKNEFKF